MLSMILGLALVAASPAACLKPDKADVLVERRLLEVGEGRRLEAFAVSRRGDGMLGYESSRLEVFDEACRRLHLQVFDASTETRLATGRLGDLPILVATALRPGGSGCGYEQVVLGFEDSLFALAPRRLDHSNMDGFFIGDLDGGRGPGLMLWEAIWADGESHYAPHAYRLTRYRWADHGFVGPETVITTERHAGSPDEVAKALGLPFADQTDPKRFTLSLPDGDC